MAKATTVGGGSCGRAVFRRAIAENMPVQSQCNRRTSNSRTCAPSRPVARGRTGGSGKIHEGGGVWRGSLVAHSSFSVMAVGGSQGKWLGLTKGEGTRGRFIPRLYSHSHWIELNFKRDDRHAWGQFGGGDKPDVGGPPVVDRNG